MFISRPRQNEEQITSPNRMYCYATPHFRLKLDKLLLKSIIIIIIIIIFLGLIPVAARSKRCVYDRSLDGIAGSNPYGRVDVRLL